MILSISKDNDLTISFPAGMYTLVLTAITAAAVSVLILNTTPLHDSLCNSRLWRDLPVTHRSVIFQPCAATAISPSRSSPNLSLEATNIKDRLTHAAAHQFCQVHAISQGKLFLETCIRGDGWRVYPRRAGSPLARGGVCELRHCAASQTNEIQRWEDLAITTAGRPFLPCARGTLQGLHRRRHSLPD
ncbi:hypothetical protein GWK47_026615 [Chionoecetes opilio]|uniref:Uncharacterized protein n=1 Tax=Chionoecetes opilio TaxID=41210 RepID=A0A8J8WLZ6_CHIOP|nr:hypothetical protein GWK47_026615 [Chionoecetes opilio]